MIMKKIARKVLSVIFLLFIVSVLTSCSEENGVNEVSSGSIKEKGFPIITDESKYIEPVSVIVNESYVLKYPDWKIKVQNAIDSVNVGLNKNPENKKQFIVAKFETYPDKNITDMYVNGLGSEYRYDAGYPYCWGTTLVLFIYDEEKNKPAMFSGILSSNFHTRRAVSDGRRINEAWIAYSESFSPFTNLTLGMTWYEWSLESIYQEMVGHPGGLAAEEYYRYNLVWDSSNVLPKLEQFDAQDYFQNDPMLGASFVMKFTNFSSFVINRNSEHTYTAEQIAEGIPDVIKVRVFDRYGNLVSGAKVRVFAGLWGNAWVNVPVSAPILLLEKETDENGEVVINSDDGDKTTFKDLTLTHKFGPKLAAKIIKAELNGMYAGSYLLLYELERAYLQFGMNTYTVELKLKPFE